MTNSFAARLRPEINLAKKCGLGDVDADIHGKDQKLRTLLMMTAPGKVV